MSNKKLVSIVIPCYREEGNIGPTFDGLHDVLGDTEYDYEIIAVNDGSPDNTWEVIKKYAQKDQRIKGINFTKNYGQTAAYQVGFDNSKGEYVLILNADLEQPLKYVLDVIRLLDQGYDLVNTHRVGRWEGSEEARKVKSNYANKLIKMISGVNVNDRGSGLKGFKRFIIDDLKLYGEMHRFLPDYASALGAKITEIEVEFKDREYGVSYYKGHKRTIKVLLDLMTLWFMLNVARKPFRAMPGRLFSFTGSVISGFGGLGALYLLVLKLMGESIGGRPLFMISVLMLVVGVQMMMMGMIGELLMRVYFESSGRKTYSVREIIQ